MEGRKAFFPFITHSLLSLFSSLLGAIISVALNPCMQISRDNLLEGKSLSSHTKSSHVQQGNVTAYETFQLKFREEERKVIHDGN